MSMDDLAKPSGVSKATIYPLVGLQRTTGPGRPGHRMGTAPPSPTWTPAACARPTGPLPALAAQLNQKAL